MNGEVRLNRAASKRIQNMEDALHEYQAGRISKQKFIGVCTTMCNFNRNYRNAEFWEADYEYAEQNRVYVAAAEFKDKSRGITPPISQRALIAKRLKMPEDSIIVGKVVSGQMTFDEAVPICDAIRHRHKNTAYDSLLARGVSKDDAREIIKTHKEMKTYSEFKTSLAESVKPKLITPKEMADYKVKKVLAVGTRPNNESIVATCEWGKKKFVQLEKMGKTGNINQIVQATFFDTEKEAMDEMRDRGFKILKHHGIAIPHLESVDQDEEMVNEYYRRAGSPRWITAKYNGIDSKGKPFKKGEEVLYFPNGNKFYTGAEAERAWQEFLSAKGDEEGRPYAS